MQKRYPIVSVRIVGHDEVHHVLHQEQHARLKRHAPLQHDGDEEAIHELLESVAKDFVTRKGAEDYVRSMRGAVSERMKLTLAPMPEEWNTGTGEPREDSAYEHQSSR